MAKDNSNPEVLGADDTARVLRAVQPHERGIFTRLLDMFGWLSHPPYEPSGEDISEAAAMANWWEKQFSLSAERRERYRIFLEMDTFDLVQSVFDAYGEEATQRDRDKGLTVWIESANQSVVNEGMNCFENVQLEDRIMAITRRTALLGDDFRRLIYKTGKGVMAWKFADPSKCHREHDKFERLVGFKEDGQKFRGERKYPISWPWDYVHFRLLGKNDDTQYGTGLAAGMFRAWRQMTLAEDAMLMYRLRRAPDRNVIFVDVGTLDPVESMEYVNKWRKRFRKTEFIDPASPDYRKQYNPLTPMEDIFWPVRPDTNSRVEPLAGGGDVGQVYDLDYYVNKFFGTARAPKAYFGFEGEINAKATLMQQDIRFARTIKRLQRAVIYGLRNLLDIHFGLMADHEKYNTPYLLQMAAVSYLDEMERLELLQLRNNIVDAMSRWAQDMQLDPRVWATYLLLNYAKLPEEMVLKLIRKTPPDPVPPMPGGDAGGGGEMESLMQMVRDHRQMNNDERARWLEAMRKDRYLTEAWESVDAKGFYPLSVNEQRIIAEAVHGSPRLRKSISDIVSLMEYDVYDLSQRDTTIAPPHGVNVNDDYAGDVEAAMLREHLEELKTKKG